MSVTLWKGRAIGGSTAWCFREPDPIRYGCTASFTLPFNSISPLNTFFFTWNKAAWNAAHSQVPVPQQQCMEGGLFVASNSCSSGRRAEPGCALCRTTFHAGMKVFLARPSRTGGYTMNAEFRSLNCPERHCFQTKDSDTLRWSEGITGESPQLLCFAAYKAVLQKCLIDVNVPPWHWDVLPQGPGAEPQCHSAQRWVSYTFSSACWAHPALQTAMRLWGTSLSCKSFIRGEAVLKPLGAPELGEEGLWVRPLLSSSPSAGWRPRSPSSRTPGRKTDRRTAGPLLRKGGKGRAGAAPGTALRPRSPAGGARPSAHTAARSAGAGRARVRGGICRPVSGRGAQSGGVYAVPLRPLLLRREGGRGPRPGSAFLPGPRGAYASLGALRGRGAAWGRLPALGVLMLGEEGADGAERRFMYGALLPAGSPARPRCAGRPPRCSLSTWVWHAALHGFLVTTPGSPAGLGRCGCSWSVAAPGSHLLVVPPSFLENTRKPVPFCMQVCQAFSDVSPAGIPRSGCLMLPVPKPCSWLTVHGGGIPDVWGV